MLFLWHLTLRRSHRPPQATSISEKQNKDPPIHWGYNCNNVYLLTLSGGARFMSINLPLWKGNLGSIECEFKIMSMEEESRHSIASQSIFDITMSSISSALCEDTQTASLVSAVNIHDTKPAHQPTIPDSPLPTLKIAAITQVRHHKLTPPISIPDMEYWVEHSK